MAWDSGRVEAAAAADVAYGGSPLTAGGRYRWKVRVWDEDDRASEWSDPARFEVELDRTGGWHASWIAPGRVREAVTPPSGAGPVDPVARALTPAPYLRRVFAVGQPVTSARLYVTALGLYEARMNGRRVGDGFLTPGWTDYRRRIAYQAYDVTSLLAEGENVLGAIVADGWYAGFYGFDPRRAGAHYGEIPELLAELVLRLADGSEQRIVTDGQWRSSAGAIRHADLLMGERHDLTREPHGWDKPRFDASYWRAVQARERGQNLTGWLRIKIDGPPGACIRIRHGEVLAADGSLYTDNLRTARATDEFTTAGGSEMLEPRFTLHGFRYAEITGYPGDIGQADVTARVVHSDAPATGSLESSVPWLDQLFRVIDWGQRGNFISVPTDCPQRDERLGWLGDAQVFARTACYNRDVAAFFAKWLDDVADAQLPSGAFTDVAPQLTLRGTGAPAWGDAGVIVPWTMWKMYGDTGVLDRHFGAMTRWMDFLERANPGYLRARELGNSYNDWLTPGDDDTPHELLATAYWAHDAALMAEIADELRAAAAGRLVAAIRAADWHLTTGFAGVGYLLPVLSSAGYDGVAYRLLEQDTMPSWRYMTGHGATTIWERWDGWTAERGFASPWMNSFNHYSLGSVGEWLYRYLLGIDQEPGTAGFGRLLLRPHPGGSLDWARGSYASVRGTIRAGWKRDRGRFTYWAELPPNVTATIRIPSRDAAEVRDAAGNPPSALAGFPGAADAQEAVFEVGSGTHEFSGPAMNDPGRS